MSEKYDIVIVGAGPVGLMLSACLARYGNYRIKIIDIKPERTQIGRADGIQARTLDILHNMGLKRPIMAYDPGRIYEVAFWEPRKDGTGICRRGTWRSYPDFIDTRYHFTIILHQGRIEKIFNADLEKRGISVERPCTISGVENDGVDTDYPVKVNLEHLGEPAHSSTVRAKYVFAADGARSFVRKQLGIPMIYKDPTVNVWGVVDGVVISDFPDMAVKCTVHSDYGSSMIIPHGNNVVRLYVQLMSEDEQDPRQQATLEKIQETAKKILQPYKVEWERVDWFSAYPIAQGIAEHYTLDNRIFIGGDACHTHSPKAGQGMNFGLLDAQNFSWKLHLIESGFLKPSLFATYESERKMMAQKLIDFDSKYAALFSSKLKDFEVTNSGEIIDQEGTISNEFVKTFKQNSFFTSGYAVDYGSNLLNWSEGHLAKSSLFQPPGVKLTPGTVFPLATVTRVYDALPTHLEQEIPQNGAYRVYVFAGKPNNPTTTGKLKDFADALAQPTSFLSRYLRTDIDTNATVHYDNRYNPHSLFFSFCVIFTAPRTSLELHEVLPGMLAGCRFLTYADDISSYEVKAEGRGAGTGAMHEKLGFDVEKGGVVIVRPDGYVACTVSLEGRESVQAINSFLGPVVTKSLGVTNGM